MAEGVGASDGAQTNPPVISSLSESEILREFEPLTHLCNLIPHKAQHGLTVYNLDLTCIDASLEYVALGSTLGLVFLYDREKQTLQRLSCQSKTEIVTCVKMHQSLDYQVAFGTLSGLLCIFTLPSMLPGRNRQLQMFKVPGVHHARITCLQWSLNGMKLFSGDEMGNVVCTEIDHEENKSMSSTVIKESHKIIQLDYAHKLLLISTRLRTVLCKTEDKNSIIQVGQKERKCLGNFGACFVPGSLNRADTNLFAARPSFRLWKSDTNGTVLHTHIFKDLISSAPSIQLLNTIAPSKTVVTPSDTQFGPLTVFNENSLMTWNDSTLYVVDPNQNTVLGCSNTIGILKDVASCGDEIFILRLGTDRNIIRIGLQPEPTRLVKEHIKLTTLELTPPPSPVDKTLRSSLTASPSEQERRRSSSPLMFLFGKMKSKDNKKVPNTFDKRQKSGSGVAENASHAMSLNPVNIAENAVESLKGLVAPKAVLGSDVINKVPQEEKPLEEDLPPIIRLDAGVVSKIEINEVAHEAEGCEQPELYTETEAVIAVESTENPENHNKDNKNHTESPKSDIKNPSVEEYDDNAAKRSPEIKIDNPGVGQSVEPPAALPELKEDIYAKIAQQDFNDDIVFQKKPKKTHKKKNKHGKRESDSDSLASLEVYFPLDSADAANTVTGEHSDRSVSPSRRSPSPRRPSSPRQPSPSPQSSPRKQSPSPRSDRVFAEEPGLVKENKMSVSTDQTDFVESGIDSKLKTSSDSEIVSGNSQLNEMNLDTVSSGVGIQNNASCHGNDFKSGTKLVQSQNQKDIHSMAALQTNLETQPTETTEHAFKEPSSFESASIETSAISETSSKASLYNTSDTSTEDFYGKYKSDSKYSLTSPTTPAEVKPSPFDMFENLERQVSQSSGMSETSSGSQASKSTDTEQSAWPKLHCTWAPVTMQGNVQSICLSGKHVWCVDKSERLYCSSLVGPGIKWKMLDVKANQIAVSKSGWIVWRLHRGIVYAGTKITPRNPGGLHWVEALKNVKWIAVDDSTAWYITSKHEVRLQKTLSKERPCFKSLKVSCPYTLTQIYCNSGVVWALDDRQRLFVRTGIRQNCPEGREWEECTSFSKHSTITSVSLGDRNFAWVMDSEGRVWFCSGVNMETPMGDGNWWQLSYSEYYVHDKSALDTIKSTMMTAVEIPQNISKGLLPQTMTKSFLGPQGGLITASADGVWACPDYKNTLQVCRGVFVGHRWDLMTPGTMAQSTKWKLISAGTACGNSGLIWAVQPNGDVFCFPPNVRQSTSIGLPPGCGPFSCLSAGRDAVWGLMENGKAFIRTGVGPHCPQGASWDRLELGQLGDKKLVHLSCGTENVWAVDHEGTVYLRIGVKAPTSHYLPPAWVPVDGETQGGTISQVATGPEDWKVWCIDSRKSVYVRTDVSPTMPIGKAWIQVPGTTAIQLCISKGTVWALSSEGEVLCRYGVTKSHPLGDYWKKIPGSFAHLSVSANDDLWAINKDGQLYKHSVNYFRRSDDDGFTLQRSISTNSDEGDWEML